MEFSKKKKKTLLTVLKRCYDNVFIFLGLFFFLSPSLPFDEKKASQSESRLNSTDERKYRKMSSAWPPLSLNVTITQCRHVRFDGQNNWTRSRRSHNLFRRMDFINGARVYPEFSSIFFIFRNFHVGKSDGEKQIKILWRQKRSKKIFRRNKVVLGNNSSESARISTEESIENPFKEM